MSMTNPCTLEAVEEIFSVYIRVGEQPSYHVTKAIGDMIGKSPNEILQLFFQTLRHPGDRLNAGCG
jgi:hypothetical protein